MISSSLKSRWLVANLLPLFLIKFHDINAFSYPYYTPKFIVRHVDRTRGTSTGIIIQNNNVIHHRRIHSFVAVSSSLKNDDITTKKSFDNTTTAKIIKNDVKQIKIDYDVLEEIKPVQSLTNTTVTNMTSNSTSTNTTFKRIETSTAGQQEEEEEEPSSSSLPFSTQISDFLGTPQVEVFDTFLVLFSSLLVAISTLPASSFPSIFSAITFRLEDVLSNYFGLEFFLRWYGLGQLKPEYLTKPLALVDIFVVVLPLFLTNVIPFLGGTDLYSYVPTWLMSGSGLMTLRLLRILRILRILSDLDSFYKFEQALGLDRSSVRPYQLQLARVLLSIFTLCTVSTGLIYTAEHEVNPNIPDYFTALYFGLTTLTTVGFGDITPVTAQGRLVVSGSILAGVAIIPAQAAELVEALIDYQNERRQKNEIRRKKDEEAEWSWRRPQCDIPTEDEKVVMAELMNDNNNNSSSSEMKDLEWSWRRPSCSTGACDVSTITVNSNISSDTEGNKSMNIVSSAVENNDPVQTQLVSSSSSKSITISSKPPVCFNCGAEANVADASYCWSCGSKLSCSSCGAGSHRVDASFCWKCGDSLKKNSQYQ